MLADSEVLSNTVIADVVTELGVPTTVDDAYRTFMGKRLSEVIETIEAVTGRTLPPDFTDAYQQRTFEAFRARLTPVGGAREFLEKFLGIWREVPRRIASSSSPERLALSLEVLNMTPLFEGRVFSASNVARGKPHPDIFLHAAEQLGIVPGDCIVIEDSVGGATDLLVDAAIAGTGIVPLFEDWLRPHFESGALEPLLEPWWQRFAGPYLYYPGRRLVPAPLRAFVDFIKASADKI